MREEPSILITHLGTGEKALWEPDETRPAHLHDQLTKIKISGQSTAANTARGECFFHCYAPRRRMILIGAVHISQILTAMGRTCGFEVFVVDPRGAFATKFRFPGSEVSIEWPDTALMQIGIDSATAIITLTHDAKIDDLALRTGGDCRFSYVADN